MNLIWKYCPNSEILQRYQEMSERGEDEYVEERVLKRSSAVWVEIYENHQWIGYALLERLDRMNLSFVLDDIWDEDEFDQAMTFVENHLQSNGYYLHVFQIFREFRGKGWGSQAEKILMEQLNGPTLLYTVSESENFWFRQGYKSLDEGYYLYKGAHHPNQLAG